MNENLLLFFKKRPEVFPFKREIDLQRFLLDAIDRPADALPAPAKIFLLDELAPHAYGFPLTKSPILDDLEGKVERWMNDEVAARVDASIPKSRADESLQSYRSLAIKIARNALHSSILADYHAVFWLVHSQQLARLFTALPRKVLANHPAVARDQVDTLRYTLAGRWSGAMREAVPEIVARSTDGTRFGDEINVRFLELLIENPLLVTEDYISSDLRELRSYISGSLRRDFGAFRKAFEDLRTRAAELMTTDRLFRRAMTLLGYPESAPNFIAVLDRRVQQLITEHPASRPIADAHVIEGISKRLLEYFLVYNLRRGILWMKTTADGDNISDDPQQKMVYSRGIRPMNFGRRGIVEPIVYRFGLVYDITSFTQTLGEVARSGKEEEQTSYRQMLEFQRDLAEMTHRHGLQFEKFLGDGAFYTARRAMRSMHAAIEMQQFYSTMKARGFAFNKGMRIALNYGYYRLLPMQVSSDGTEIMEFYGPGIVELSRLTSGKATKEIEDIQHLLLSHGYDQNDVYRFFSPLSRSVGREPAAATSREFYAYVNESGHLINEGIVASIPFLKELTKELEEDKQRIYRLRTDWASYVGFPAPNKDAGYIGIRILGSVSLKGIGMQEVAEVIRVTHEEAEISLIDDDRPLLQLLEQERNRSAALAVAEKESDADTRLSDLVVCESHIPSGGDPVILVGEWDPVSEEVRRPIQLDGQDAERYGLEVPLTAAIVESQSVAYQKLYRKLSRMETLPNFSVQAIRANANFSGFIIGETIERL